MSFSAKLEGTEATLKYLKDLTDKLSDVKGFNEEIGLDSIKEIEKSFDKSEDPTGGRWAPLKKKRPDGTSKPLVPTNPKLAKSFRILKLSADEVIIGSTLTYGRWHQEGTNTIPRRAFLPFTEGGALVVTKTMQGIIDRAMDKWFGTFDKKDSGD